MTLWHLRGNPEVSPSGPGRGSDACFKGLWARALAASVEIDSIFKYRQVSHRPPSGIQGNGTDQFPLSQKPPKMWKANCLSCGDYFSLEVLLLLSHMLGVPPPIPLPPPLLALLHCVSSAKHRTQRPGHLCTSPGSSWGLPSTFTLLHSSFSYLIAPHLSLHCPLAPQSLTLQAPLHRLPSSF